MNPLGEAMDIIYLGFKQSYKTSKYGFASEILNWILDCCSNWQKAVEVTYPDQGDGQSASQSHRGSNLGWYQEILESNKQKMYELQRAHERLEK